jgi:hypothetical protein
MRPGDIDFSRYDRPGMCEQVAYTVKIATWRRGEHDTISYKSRLRDTLPAKSVERVQACVQSKSFDITHMTVSDLRAMLRLAFIANDDQIAQQVIDQQFKNSASDTARAAILSESIGDALAARPLRINLALRALARMDSLGTSVLEQRLLAHDEFVSYYNSIDDATSMQHQIDQALTISDAMPSLMRSRNRDRISSLYEQRWELMLAEQGFAAPGLDVFIQQVDSIAGSQFGMRRNIERRYLGTSFRLPLIPYWYRPDGTRAPQDSNGTQPRPGHVTLVLRVNPLCGSVCHKQYAALRRVYEQYAARGFDIILLAKTSGFSTGTLTQTPDQEAEAIRTYYQEYLQLPVTVGVEVTPYTHRPAPDNRRVNALTPSERAYRVPLPLPGHPLVVLGQFLLDQQGRIQMLQFDGESAITTAALDRLLSKTHE